MTDVYDDGLVRFDEQGLTIRRYSFPLLGSKRVPWSAIRAYREFELTPLTGRWRIWGSGDFRHWFGLDTARARKSKGFILDVGRWMRPMITPDDPDRVRALLLTRVGRTL